MPMVRNQTIASVTILNDIFFVLIFDSSRVFFLEDQGQPSFSFPIIIYPYRYLHNRIVIYINILSTRLIITFFEQSNNFC